MTAADVVYMQRALELARMGLGLSSPNPMVGALVVKNGSIIAEGYHRERGAAHAEVIALEKAGVSAKGATLYCNLEPCCHFGTTPPCTEAITRAGIARVVYAVTDPDRRVAGRGMLALQKAGIEVSKGVLESESAKLNEAYLHSQKKGRPFVVAKVAQSLDGRIATLYGDSKWISSIKSRTRSHELRAEYDAVLIGSGTLMADRPSLTVRHSKGRNPYRIVVSANLARLSAIKPSNDGRTIVASTPESVSTLTQKNGKLIYWPIRADRFGKLRLDLLLKSAHEFGLRSILVEGGSSILTSFFKARLVDKFIQFTAPILIGEGVPVIRDLGVKRIAKSIHFREPKLTTCGPDYLFTGYPVWRK